MDPLRKSVAYSTQNDVEYARSIARKMFEMYDKDHSSNIENYEVSPMMQDAYRNMNRSFNPSKFDIEGYAKVMDRNGDGRVTLGDLESLCIKYLCGESALNQSTSYNYKTSEETIKRANPGSYLPEGGVRSNALGHLADVHYSIEPSSRTTEYRSVTLSGGPGSYEAVKRSGAGTAGYPNDSLSRSAIYINKGKLDQIRRVFDKFDEDKNGFIDEDELKNLMEETYRILGVNRTISNEDVHSYFSLIDNDRDGRISYPEYETIVTKALARINVKFE